MINEILNGIIAALHGEFGDDCRYYDDKVEEDLTEPCFFITCIDASNNVYRGRRRKHDYLCMIQYLPGDGGRQACWDTSDKLYRILEVITVSDSAVRGVEMSAEIVDEALHFSVNYGFFSFDTGTEEKMDNLEQGQTAIKGE